MLKIKNLQVAISDKEILKGINLRIKAGETHAIMGQNGSGKTTLAKVLAGSQEGYGIKGEIRFLGKDILKMEPEDRARCGIFMAFQNPVEIPGVALSSFLNASFNEISQAQGRKSLDPIDFSDSIGKTAKAIGLKREFLSRGVNEGFSGGERKKNEIFQMLILQPRLAILDEIDSGLDIDALKKVAKVISGARKKDNAFLVITHYQRILNYIKPDFVHIMVGGRIVKSGNSKLALEVEKNGYEYFS